jgi:hypothetical protein
MGTAPSQKTRRTAGRPEHNNIAADVMGDMRRGAMREAQRAVWASFAISALPVSTL